MTGLNLLNAPPGSDVRVLRARDGAVFSATADSDGIVRNDDGEAYGDGPYRLLDDDRAVDLTAPSEVDWTTDRDRDSDDRGDDTA